MGEISSPTAGDYAMATAQQALAEVQRMKKPAMLKKIDELESRVRKLEQQLQDERQFIEVLLTAIKNRYKIIQ